MMASLKAACERPNRVTPTACAWCRGNEMFCSRAAKPDTAHKLDADMDESAPSDNHREHPAVHRQPMQRSQYRQVLNLSLQGHHPFEFGNGRFHAALLTPASQFNFGRDAVIVNIDIIAQANRHL